MNDLEYYQEDNDEQLIQKQQSMSLKDILAKDRYDDNPENSEEDDPICEQRDYKTEYHGKGKSQGNRQELQLEVEEDEEEEEERKLDDVDIKCSPNPSTSSSFSLSKPGPASKNLNKKAPSAYRYSGKSSKRLLNQKQQQQQQQQQLLQQEQRPSEARFLSCGTAEEIDQEIARHENLPQVIPVKVAVHVRPYEIVTEETDPRRKITKSKRRLSSKFGKRKKASKREILNNQMDKKLVADDNLKYVQVPVMPAWGCREEAKRFTYDYVFQAANSNEAPNNEEEEEGEGEESQGAKSSVEKLYEECVLPLLDGCFQGLNATVLAYGQTGSGKTYTMGTNGARHGVIPRLATNLFERVMELEANNDMEYSVQVSFFEIYREVLSDLLIGKSPYASLREMRDRDSSYGNGLCIREDNNKNVFVAGLTQVACKTEEELLTQLEIGCSNRATGSTSMNNTSSRSHAVFTITVTANEKTNGIVKTSKFHLVDLAGSERAKKTKAKGDRFAEGVDINLGLLALGNVISALGDDHKGARGGHVPYRDSKLTRILQDSLGGNSRTLMVACISRNASNFEETTSTLRYANRARKIKNKPVKNNTLLHADKVIEGLRAKIVELEAQLLETEEKLETKTSEMSELSDRNASLEEQVGKMVKLLKDLKAKRDKNGRRRSSLLRRGSKGEQQFKTTQQLEDEHAQELEQLRQQFALQLAALEAAYASKGSNSSSRFGCMPSVSRPKFKRIPMLPRRFSHSKKQEGEAVEGPP